LLKITNVNVTVVIENMLLRILVLKI